MHEGKNHTLKEITSGSHGIITSHCMDKLLKRGHSSIIAQFNAIQVVETTPLRIHPDFRLVLSKNQHVFEIP
jgi:hypothetical protein